MQLRLNEKGQEFSVFKLLISAVIAIVILTILLQMLGLLGGFGQGNPFEEAKTTLKTATTNVASENPSKVVTFKTGDSVGAKALATAVDLSEDQICISLGQFLDDPSGNWEGTGKMVKYTGTGAKKTKWAILCDVGKDLTGSVTDYGSLLEPGWLSDCACAADEYMEKCCVLALVKTSD